MNSKPTTKEPGFKAPADLRRALAANQKAKAQWNDLTPIGRRDFISWIESAKQLETRKRRVKVACDKLVKGMRRPCCYAIVPMDLYKALGSFPRAKAQWKDLTPDGRRDFTDWINAAKEHDVRMGRIKKVCTMLVAGKKRP